MDKKREGKVNYAGLIATIGTAVLAITALITVYITLSAWKEDREANRPYFTFKESPQVMQESGLEFQMKFTNVGEHPAVNLWSKSLVLSSALGQEEPIAMEEYALVNDIPQNASATLLIDLEKLEEDAARGEVKPHFIVVYLRYEDSIIHKEFEQALYIRWDGMKDRQIQGTTHGSEEEKKAVEAYLQSRGLL